MLWVSKKVIKNIQTIPSSCLPLNYSRAQKGDWKYFKPSKILASQLQYSNYCMYSRAQKGDWKYFKPSQVLTSHFTTLDHRKGEGSFVRRRVEKLGKYWYIKRKESCVWRRVEKLGNYWCTKRKESCVWRSYENTDIERGRKLVYVEGGKARKILI